MVTRTLIWKKKIDENQTGIYHWISKNIYAPEADPNMEMTSYVRSFEQNEELGLNDMKTENYSEDWSLKILLV